MFKSFKRLSVIFIIALALVGCSSSGQGNGAEKVTLRVGGSQEDQEFLKNRIEAFKASNPDKEYEIETVVIGEPDARDLVLKDVEAAPDLFAFADDHIRDLVASKALYEITLNKDAVINDNVEGSVEAATIDDKLYAYPFTADNGYFLYYNKNVISEQAAESLEAIMDDAAAAGKKVYIEVSNSWYLPAFFFGAGLGIDYKDGRNIIDWNNETGVAVGEYLRELVNHPAFISGGDEVLDAGVADGSIVAAFTGVWKAEAFSEDMGDGYAATKLPTFNLKGASTQLGSFAGFKLYGVNSMTKYPEDAMALAYFLTNEESQQVRFEMRKAGPSNINVKESDAVKSEIALNALAEQSVYAKPQRDVQEAYWTPAEAFGTAIQNKSTDNMQDMLDTLVSQVEQ